MADVSRSIGFTFTADNAQALAAVRQMLAAMADLVVGAGRTDAAMQAGAQARAAATEMAVRGAQDFAGSHTAAALKVGDAWDDLAVRSAAVRESVREALKNVYGADVVPASLRGVPPNAGGVPALPPVADAPPAGRVDVARQKAAQAMRDTTERDRAESIDAFSPVGKREEQHAMARAKADHEFAVLEAKHGVAGVQHNQEYHDALQAIHQRYVAACQRADEEYDKWIEADAARKVARAQRDHETLVSIKQTGVKAAADADEARTPAERLKKRNDEDFAAYTRAAAGVDRKAAEVTADSPEHQQVIDAGQETKRQLYLEYQRKVRDNQARFRAEELAAIEKQGAAERKQFEERVRQQDHLATQARSVRRDQDRLELEEAREQGTGPALAVLEKQLAAKHAEVQDAQGRVQTAVGYEPRLQAEREYVAALQDERVIKVQIRLEETKQGIEAGRATAEMVKEILAQRAKDEQFAKKKFELQNLAVIAGLRGEKRELVTDAKDSGLPDNLLGKLDLTQDKDAIYAQIKRLKLEMRFVTPDLTADQKAEVEGLIDQVISAGESKRSEWQEFWKEMGGDIGKGLDDATHNTLEQISKGFLAGKTRWNKITKELLSDLEGVGSKAMADTATTALKASLQAAMHGAAGMMGRGTATAAAGAPSGYNAGNVFSGQVGGFGLGNVFGAAPPGGVSGVGGANLTAGVASFAQSIPQVGQETKKLAGTIGQGTPVVGSAIQDLAKEIAGGKGGGSGILGDIIGVGAQLGTAYFTAGAAAAGGGSFLSAFSFDTAPADSRARRWGLDFGTSFGQGAHDGIHSSSGGGPVGGGGHTINIHVEQHNHGGGGDGGGGGSRNVNQNSDLAAEIAAHVRRALRTL